MPHDANIEFGKRAVAEGLITQKKLDEIILLLHSLEMAGSDKKLRDLLIDKGLIKPSDVTRLRGEVAPEGKEAASAFAKATADKPATQPEGKPAPPRVEGTCIIVYLPERQEAQFHRLIHRPLNIGSDNKSDIVIEESGVDKKHARITQADHGPTIWDVGSERGVLTNGVRKTTTELRAGDLIKIGDALLVTLFEPHGKTEPPQPLSEDAIEGELVARLHVEKGERKGETIYMGSAPVIMGRHRLATVRMEDRHVTPLHSHFVAMARGVQLTDLRTAIGTRVNDLPVSQTILKDGDVVGIGAVRLRFESTVPPRGIEQRPTEATETQEEQEPVSMPDIPTDVELDLEGAEEPDTGLPVESAAAVAERYKPGELVLTAIEGPIEGQFVVIQKAKTVIGRGGMSDVFIPDLSVSRKHAVVTLSKDGRLEIEDLNSRNGVFINNRQIKKAALRTGDAIRIGSTSLIVDRRSA